MRDYPQLEEVKPTFKQRMKDKYDYVVLCLETSYFNRVRSIKRVNREVPKLKVEDTKGLKEIEDLICRLDLTDPRYGKTLSEEIVAEFNAKLEANKQLNEKENLEDIDEYYRD